MSIQPGNTFLDTSDTPHLWIVVAGPDAASRVILLSFTSVKGRDDRTTVRDVGEHPFLTRQSVIAYKYPMYVEIIEFEQLIAHGSFVCREDCSPALLKRVAAGILKSQSMPTGIANAYVAMLWAEKKKSEDV